MPIPCPECNLLMDSNGLIAWCDKGHVWTLKNISEQWRIKVTTRERAHQALDRARLLLARTGDFEGAVTHIEDAINEACANAVVAETANMRFVLDKRGDELERLDAELAKSEANALACLDSANAHHRKKMDEYTECQKESNRLRKALESIVKLMVSMQSLGYFTNDEWQSRLTAAQEALGGKHDT